MRRPQKTSIALKQDILAVAERLFKEHGYDGTTLQMIADELNIVQGSITYHFQNKYRLVHDIIEGYRVQLHQFIRDNLEDGYNCYFYHCLQYIYSLREIMKRRRNWELYYHKDVVGPWAEEKQHLVEEMYRRIMKDFHKSFTEEELHMTAIMSLGALTRLAQELIGKGEPIDIHQFAYYHMYLIGLLAKLDETTIQNNICDAFAFADSHPAPTIYMLE